ncbi:MAG: type III pantothenate kinase [Xanthomonadaceae bacterium]|nr:type III pantothenate kinase [Xanthomonadaceae bacterium]MDE3073460.1 type III pantothenate kinase [Pseudomonadota bacterium]
MRLLLDLGNTRLKWALQPPHSAAWVAHGAALWHEDVAAVLASAWAGLPSPETVGAASVVDAAREAQVAAVVARRFGRAPVWLRTPAQACGVRNAYAEPRRLGVDRFLAMVAARAAGQAPCVLVGAGTALTLDALAADGRHLGGLIAPGPQLMQQSLLERTALVRPERPGVIMELADNTADAVASGCWQAAVALIERFATRMAARLGGVPTLVLDGGDAARLAPLLSLPAQLSRDGVLRGLAVWADTQPAQSPPGMHGDGWR